MKRIILFLSTAFFLFTIQTQCTNTQEALAQKSSSFAHYISPGFKTLSGGLLLYWAGDRIWESVSVIKNAKKSNSHLATTAKYVAAVMAPVGLIGGIFFYKGIKGFKRAT